MEYKPGIIIISTVRLSGDLTKIEQSTVNKVDREGHSYLSIFTPAHIWGVSSCRDILAWLVPRLLGAKLEGDTAEQRKAAAQTEGLAGIAKEEIQGLMQDRTASHLLEVCNGTAFCSLCDTTSHDPYLTDCNAALAATYQLYAITVISSVTCAIDCLIICRFPERARPGSHAALQETPN